MAKKITPSGLTASGENPVQIVVLSQRLAEFSGVSTDDAKAVVDAMLVDASVLIEASKKLLKRKVRLSVKDIPESELNDPDAITKANKFANSHRFTRVETLPEGEAQKLRRARLIQKYDIDRRQKASTTCKPCS